MNAAFVGQNRTKVGLKPVWGAVGGVVAGVAKSNQGGIETSQYEHRKLHSAGVAKSNQGGIETEETDSESVEGSSAKSNQGGIETRGSVAVLRVPFEAKSNQGGIETSCETVTKPSRTRQNRTKVGLKPPPSPLGITSSDAAKSNQGGIETAARL